MTNTPEDINAALADAARFSKAGQGLVRWPVWAATLDAVGATLLTTWGSLFIGAMITDGTVFGLPYWTGTLIAFAIATPNVALRFWWRSKVGALAALTRWDYLAGAILVVGMGVSAYAFAAHGLWLPAVIFGVAYGADLYRRRRRPAAFAAVQK